MKRKDIIAKLDRLGLVRPARPPAPKGDARRSKAALEAMSMADLERLLKEAGE